MKKRALLALCIYLLAATLARAEKLDLSAHDAIIKKLESVAHLSDGDSMVQTTEINHRLADLYAERARLLSQEEEGQGAQKYASEITSDRQKAIATLKTVVPALPAEKKGASLLQMAHLDELMSENNEALKIYQTIEKSPKNYDQKTKALTEIKLGDFSFVSNQLSESQKHFEKSLTYSENPRKAYAHYRLAWVIFNQGQTIEAEKKLLTLLQTPKLYKNAAGEIDESFVEEATHDLATFMARNDLPKESLKSYVKVTPEKLLKKNLIYLAQELDRTAKKTNALKVWALVGNTQNLSFEDQVERQIQITRIAYDLGHYDAVITEMTHSISLLKKSECAAQPFCTLAQQNLRRVITDWARAEERKASSQLISAFAQYTQSFADYEMNYWAAGLAVQRKQHQHAFQFFLRASTILKDINPKNDQQQKLFELSLVGGIEMAEFAKDPKAKLQAYQRYLEFNPNGVQKNEVKYQIARWSYDQNDYATAREEFKKLAVDPSMVLSLREKSSDLSLDTSVLLKDESRIEKDSLELSAALKNKKSEYLSIYRKSILNQTATILNAKPTADALKAELAKLNRIDSQTFAGDEKQKLVRNKMEITYRVQDIDSLISFSKQYLALKATTVEDQQKAFQYLAWASEIRMNFKESLRYMKQVQPKQKDQPAYFLKMALLKELSTKNPTDEYEKFLRVSRDAKKNSFAAHQIVLNAANPLKAFNKYESVLRKSKELYPSAALFVYEKHADQSFAKRLLAQPSFKKSGEADFIRHEVTLNEFKNTAKQTAQAHFKSGSDSQIKKSLVHRNEMIHQLEKLTNRSIARKDFVEQVALLPVLSMENLRLANDIMSLPKPKRLSKQEKIAYDEQLKLMVGPYLKQSLAIDDKIKVLWYQKNSQDILNDLAAWSTQINRPGHISALQELSLLKSSVQSLGLTSPAFEKLSGRKQKVSSTLTEATKLQSNIYNNPFDFSYLEQMKTLQLSLGSGPMVAYIDSRISELNSRGR